MFGELFLYLYIGRSNMSYINYILYIYMLYKNLILHLNMKTLQLYKISKK